MICACAHCTVSIQGRWKPCTVFDTIVRIVRPLIIAPTQWADRLLGDGDAPVLSEVVETPRCQGTTLPFATLGPRPSRPRSTLPPERFSPMAQCCRLGRRSMSSATWGTPDVLPTLSERQLL